LYGSGKSEARDEPKAQADVLQEKAQAVGGLMRRGARAEAIKNPAADEAAGLMSLFIIKR
jgi:hypothetical protein